MPERPLARRGTHERLATLAASFAVFAVVAVLSGRVSALPIDPAGAFVAVVSDAISDDVNGLGALFLFIVLPFVGVLLGLVAGARLDPFGGWLASLGGAVLSGVVLGLVAPHYVDQDRAGESVSLAATSLGGALVMAQDFLLLCTLPFAIAAAIAWAIMRGPPT